MNEIDKLLSEIENDSFGSTTTPPPKNKREAITQSINNVGIGFVGSFKLDPLDNAAKFLENAVPRGIRDEYNVVKEASGQIKELYDNNIKDLQSGAKKTIDLIKMKTPENSVYRSVLTKLSNSLGSSDPDRNNNYNAEPTEEEIIAKSIEKVFDSNRKKDNIEQIISEVKENNKFVTTVSILTDVLGNIKYGNQFNDEITEKYYRKSLELQFKSLYVTKQQLEVTKSGFDLFKNQLESIVKNTALPDIVKIKNTEQISENIQNRFRETLTDKFYSKSNPLNNMKNNIVRNIGRYVSGAKMGFETGNMFLEQANELSASGMGPSKAEMAGGEMAAFIRNYLGDEVGRAAEKNGFIRDKLYKTKLAMADPRETLHNLANRQFDKGTRMGRISSKFLKTIGGISEADRQDFTRFGEYEPDEATIFDFRTKNAIVKIIPNLLSKIYSELKSTRTGKKEEGLFFDYSTGMLQNDSKLKENILRDTAVTFQGAAGGNLDRFTSVLEKGSGKLYTEEEKNHIKGVIVGHLIKNGSMSPEAMLKEGFLDQFDPKFRNLVKESIEGTLEQGKDDLLVLDEFRTSLEGTKNNIPSMDKQIEQYFKNGQIDTIEKMGLVDYDPLRKKYRLNRDKYTEILKDSITFDPNEEEPYPEKWDPNKSKVTSTVDSIVNDSKTKNNIDAGNLGIKRSDKKQETVEKIQKMSEDSDKTRDYNKDINRLRTSLHTSEEAKEVIQPIVEETIKTYMGSKAEAIRNMIKEETLKVTPIIKNTVDETVVKLEELNDRMSSLDLKDILSKDEVDPDVMYLKYQDSGASNTGINFLSWANTLGYTFLGKKFSKIKNTITNKNDKMKESILSKVSTNLEEMMEVDKATGKRKFSINAILKKTREWDRKMFLSIPSILGKLTAGAFKLPFTILSGLGTAKKAVFGDKDGDGDRDMGWKDRLSNAGKDIKNKIFNKEPSKATTKKTSILGSIWNMLKGTLPFLGTIAALGGKMLSGILGIVPAITGLGSLLGGVVGTIAKGVGAVVKGGGALLGGALAAGKNMLFDTGGKKVPPGKIMTALKTFKTKILKKLGKKAGMKAVAILTAKIAARAVPVAGLALLAYDGVMIAKYMMSDGLSFTSAVSKQVLGFDIEDDNDVPVDENKDPIQPDENLDIKTAGMEDEIEKENAPVKDKNIFNTTVDKIKNYMGDKTTVVGSMVDKSSNFFKTGNFKATPNKEEIFSIIDKAAARTGVDPTIMKTFAAIESGFNPNAKAPTSSAKGLFQFLDGTWKDMLKKYGGKYDLDPTTSQYDPMASSLMGAEFIKENTNALSGVRDNVGMTDLYMAHFLGAGGAKKLFEAKPDEFAAAVLPAAARANQSIFFNKDMSPKTVSEVYNLMQQRLVKKASAYGFSSDTSDEDKRTAMISNVKTKIGEAVTVPAGVQVANNINSVPSINDTPKANIIKNNIANDTINTKAPDVLTDPFNKDKTKTNFKASDSILTASSINNKEPIKTEIVDYKTNLSNIESILSNSYAVQVGIKQSLDMLVKHTLTKEEVANIAVPSLSKSVLDIPIPSVDLGKKRYNIS